VLAGRFEGRAEQERRTRWLAERGAKAVASATPEMIGKIIAKPPSPRVMRRS